MREGLREATERNQELNRQLVEYGDKISDLEVCCRRSWCAQSNRRVVQDRLARGGGGGGGDTDTDQLESRLSQARQARDAAESERYARQPSLCC